MFIACRAMEQRVLALMADAGYDTTLAQSRVVQRIAPGDSRLSDLAEQAQITKQSARFLVEALEKTGYVRRVPSDRRPLARLVQIAPRGQRAVHASRRVVEGLPPERGMSVGRVRCAES